METIARFYKGEDAYLFRSYLESQGIAAHVYDEYVPQVHWLWTNAIGGIRVMVNDDDSETAADFYKEYRQRITTGDPVVGDVKAWPIALLATFIVGVPLMLFGRSKIGKP